MSELDPAPTSTLTRSGVPFEASVSAGPGRDDEEVRYVIDVGSDRPSFAARIGAQRQALDRLIPLVPASAGSIARDRLGALVDALFPSPEVVAASIRFATWLGVVHDRGPSEQLAVIKLYGNLRADPGSLARVVARWPAFAELAATAATDRLEPMAAALQVDADGLVAHKLYLSPRGGAEHQVLEDLAPRCGLDAGALIREVAGLGLASTLWGPWVVVSLEQSSQRSLALTLHLATTPLYERGADVGAVARTVIDQLHGTTRLLDRALTAAEATGVPWRLNWFGIGFPPSAGDRKLTVYLSPDVG